MTGEKRRVGLWTQPLSTLQSVNAHLSSRVAEVSLNQQLPLPCPAADVHFTNKLSQILSMRVLLLGSVISISGSYINSFKHWSSNFQLYPLAQQKDKEMSKPTVCVGGSPWLTESALQPGLICALSTKAQKEIKARAVLVLRFGPPVCQCLHLLSPRATVQRTTKEKVIHEYLNFPGF